VLEQLFVYNTDFVPWTAEHIIPVVFFIIVGYYLIYLGKEVWEGHQKWRYPFLWSLLLPFSIILWIVLRLWRGEFDLYDDLPLHMCNLVTFFLPLVFTKRSKVIFGILYFWVMAGTLQAVLTPGLEQSFPHFWYLRYWLIHCGLVIFVLYAVIVLGFRPRSKDILYAFLAMNILFVLAHGVNLLLGSNYLYTIQKPNQPSLLDLFGPWPYYILVSEVIALLFFVIYYLPFLYLERSKVRSQ
jgi:hypothetical integral membrane protein (TIGR02206 family)